MGDFTSESQESLEGILDEEYRMKSLIMDFLNNRKRQDTEKKRMMMEGKEDDSNREEPQDCL